MDDLNPIQRLTADAMSEAYRDRYGAAVEWLKAEVAEGVEYSNDAARAVLSHNGAWCECIDLPMEFSGVTGGAVPYRFVDTGQAVALLDRLQAAGAGRESHGVRVLDLLVLYTRAGIVDGHGAYVLRGTGANHAAASGRPQVGAYRPGRMPLFFRARVAGGAGWEEIGADRAVLFVLAQPRGSHLLVVLPHDAEHVTDLGELPRGHMPQ